MPAPRTQKTRRALPWWSLQTLLPAQHPRVQLRHTSRDRLQKRLPASYAGGVPRSACVIVRVHTGNRQAQADRAWLLHRGHGIEVMLGRSALRVQVLQETTGGMAVRCMMGIDVTSLVQESHWAGEHLRRRARREAAEWAATSNLRIAHDVVQYSHLKRLHLML